MQYFIEDRAGNRVKVDEFLWMVDRRKPNYRQLHTFGNMLSYRLI